MDGSLNEICTETDWQKYPLINVSCHCFLESFYITWTSFSGVGTTVLCLCLFMNISKKYNSPLKIIVTINNNTFSRLMRHLLDLDKIGPYVNPFFMSHLYHGQTLLFSNLIHTFVQKEWNYCRADIHTWLIFLCFQVSFDVQGTYWQLMKGLQIVFNDLRILVVLQYFLEKSWIGLN